MLGAAYSPFASFEMQYKDQFVEAAYDEVIDKEKLSAFHRWISQLIGNQLKMKTGCLMIKQQKPDAKTQSR